MKKLVDNNIQIYRTMSAAWLHNKGDQAFLAIEPVVSDYVLMEYRRTAIRSIEIVCELVDHVPQGCDNKDFRDRLTDILDGINSGVVRLSSGREKLVERVVLFHLKNPRFLEGLSPKGFIAHLTHWKEELENHHFFRFAVRNKHEDPRKKGNYHQLTRCAISKNGAGYDCKKNTFPCDITSLMNTNIYRTIVSGIVDGTWNVYDKIRKNYESYSFDFEKTGKSVGRRCFGLADILHITTCAELKVGVFTGDKELSKLAKALGIRTIFYSQKHGLETNAVNSDSKC